MSENRHNYMDDYYWDRLDNAAKLVPAVSDRRSSNVFRLSAVLKEDVDPERLGRAVERALAILPAFAVRLRSGLFWYYLEKNSERPVVSVERRFPCAPIMSFDERGFLFRVTYYRRRINLELYHVLSDGTGAAHFLGAIVYCYYSLAEGDAAPEDVLRRYLAEAALDQDMDSFARSASEENAPKKEKEKEPAAYRLPGVVCDGERLNALVAVLPTADLLALARANGATLSEYLTALLIWSIFNTCYRRSGRNEPVVISVPVNLRRFFDSTTIRNFFGHLNVGVTRQNASSFADVLDAVRESFRKNVNRAYFADQIRANVGIEQIPGVRFVPLPIKDFVMRRCFAAAEKKYTCTFSNLGRLTLPEEVAGKVERFEFLLGGSKTHPKKMSCCSFGDTLTIGFSSTISDNSPERFFLTYLVGEGIDVTLTSNETPPPPAPAKEKKPKKERTRRKTADVSGAAPSEGAPDAKAGKRKGGKRR